MVASTKTIDRVVEILLRHLGREKALSVIGELSRVKGNKSFTETLWLVHERLKAVAVDD